MMGEARRVLTADEECEVCSGTGAVSVSIPIGLPVMGGYTRTTRVRALCHCVDALRELDRKEGK